MTKPPNTKYSVTKKLLTQLVKEGKLSKPITGTLEDYFETGMECTALTLYDDSKQGPKNPDFNPNKPETGVNFKNFHVHEGLNFIDSMDVIELLSKSGKVTRRIVCVPDHTKAAKHKYHLSMYVAGWSEFEFFKLFLNNRKAKLYKSKKEK